MLVHALIPLSHAQFMHRMEVRITRGAEGKTGRAFIGDMTEEMSVQLASKLASEGFIFMVSRATGLRTCTGLYLPGRKQLYSLHVLR